MAKQNRAQRRLDKFGGGRNAQHGGWPERRPNPVFGEPRSEEATAGGSDQGETAETGAGSEGGPAGPAPNPESSDPAPSTKS